MQELRRRRRRLLSTRAPAATVVVVVCLLSPAAAAPTATVPAAVTRTQAPREPAAVPPGVVTVHAAVLAHAQPVLDLDATDFRVREDGHDVRVVSATGPAAQPGRYLLLLNAGRWMRAWPAKEAAREILDALPVRACVSIVAFRESVETGVGGRPGEEPLRTWLQRLEPGGDGAIFDALGSVYGALREHRRPPTTGTCAEPRDEANGVRAVILLTFGRDEGSDAEPEEVARLASGSGVPLYVLAAVPRFSEGNLEVHGTPSPYPTMRRLERMVEFTGGFVFRGRTLPSDGLWQQLERLAAALRAHYVIRYEPPRRAAGAERWPTRHRIRIDVVGRRGVEVVAPSHLVYPRGR